MLLYMKSSTLTLRLDSDLDALLEKLVEQTGRSCSELAREALVAEILATLSPVLWEEAGDLQSPIALRDPTDEPILAAAAASGAAVLVTGDADLLAVAADAPLPILGPRDFWMQQRTG